MVLRVAGFLAVVLAGTGVSAATMSATFEGKVYNSISGREDFSPDPLHPIPVEGKRYVLGFVYDTDLGLPITITEGDSRLGPPYSSENPILSAQLSINGVTKSLTTMTFSVAEVAEWGGTPYIRFSAQNSPPTGPHDPYFNRQIYIQVPSEKIKLDLEKPFRLKGSKDIDGTVASYFEFISHSDEWFKTEFVLGNLSVNRVTVRRIYDEPSEVPLPATAGLLIAAIGGLALSACRRGGSGQSS